MDVRVDKGFLMAVIDLFIFEERRGKEVGRYLPVLSCKKSCNQYLFVDICWHFWLMKLIFAFQVDQYKWDMETVLMKLADSPEFQVDFILNHFIIVLWVTIPHSYSECLKLLFLSFHFRLPNKIRDISLIICICLLWK